MKTLTAKQAAVLRAAWAYRDLHGYSPTLRELAQTLGRCHVTVMGHLLRLEQQQYLTRSHAWARSIVPLRRVGGLRETLAELGVGKVLEAIGREACLRHFGIVAVPLGATANVKRSKVACG